MGLFVGSTIPFIKPFPLKQFAHFILAACLCHSSASLMAQISESRNYLRSDAEAKRLVEQVFQNTRIIDGHNDFYHSFYDCKTCSGRISDFPLDSIHRGNTNIPLFRKGQVGAQLYNVYGKDRKIENLLKAFDLLYQMESQYPNDLMIASSVSDMRKAWRENKVALLPILEGAVLLQDSKELLRMYYKLGLRSVTFAYKTNNLADGSDDIPKHQGISDLGKDMIREMNRIGIIIDMSHISAEAMRQILRTTQAPVIFSHSNAYTLCKVNRNVPDDVMLQLKENKGIIMINFLPQYISQKHADWLLKAELDWKQKLSELKDTVATDKYYNEVWMKNNPEPVVTVVDVADHFDYIKKLIGVDHIGIGSDLGDYYEFTTKGMTDGSCFPSLLVELAKRGWTATELKKISQENFLRVFASVEQQRK